MKSRLPTTTYLFIPIRQKKTLLAKTNKSTDNKTCPQQPHLISSSSNPLPILMSFSFPGPYASPFPLPPFLPLGSGKGEEELWA